MVSAVGLALKDHGRAWRLKALHGRPLCPPAEAPAPLFIGAGVVVGRGDFFHNGNDRRAQPDPSRSGVWHGPSGPGRRPHSGGHAADVVPFRLAFAIW